MVKLHFHYREIEETDFTGVVVEIEEAGRVVARFSNFDQTVITGEIWGNQTETFLMDSTDMAQRFLMSSGDYSPLAPPEDL